LLLDSRDRVYQHLSEHCHERLVRASALATRVSVRRAAMSSIATQLLRESAYGEIQALPRAGTSLENPWVYDAVGREMQEFAKRGLIDVVVEREAALGDANLLTEFQYKRRR
jgi:hypothetical protein